MVRKFICYPENLSAETISLELLGRGYTKVLTSSWSKPLDQLADNQAILFSEVNVALVGDFKENLSDTKMLDLNVIEEGKITLGKPENFSKEIALSPNNWGLQRIKLPIGNFKTKKINVAIVDSGVDSSHEIFSGRRIIHRSFISNCNKDLHGHGTFCAGLSYGYKTKNKLRIGIAPQTKIFSCKILDEVGEGSQGDIIRGVIWSIKKKCKILNMSLGYRNIINQKNDEPIRRVLNYARKNDCIVVCGVGNDSDRDDETLIEPLNFPASCDSAIAVTAIDRSDKIYHNANRAFNKIGQIIHFSAPGIGIFSAWSSDSVINEIKYNVLDGTSYATAYVSGILTLYRQHNPGLGADEIIDKAINNVEPFDNSIYNHHIKDYGLGLINI